LNGGAASDAKKLFFHVSDVLNEATNGEQAPSAASSSVNTSTTVNNNSVNLKPGDEVEFLVAHNPRNGKYSATKIKRLHSSSSENQSSIGTQQQQSSGTLNASEQVDAKRPERLITKLKVANIDDKSGKQLILIRQPNNPDGKTKSFSKELKERLPGSLTPLDPSNKATQGSENQQVSSLSILELLMAQQQQQPATTTS
jgi:hypothetical protein